MQHYTKIPDEWMALTMQKKISINEVVLLSRLSGLSNNDKGAAWCSNANLASWMQTTDRSIRRYLCNLENTGLIKRFMKGKDSYTTERLIYVQYDEIKKLLGERTDLSGEDDSCGQYCPEERTNMVMDEDIFDRECGQDCPPNIIINNINNIINNEGDNKYISDEEKKKLKEKLNPKQKLFLMLKYSNLLGEEKTGESIFRHYKLNDHVYNDEEIANDYIDNIDYPIPSVEKIIEEFDHMIEYGEVLDEKEEQKWRKKSIQMMHEILDDKDIPEHMIAKKIDAINKKGFSYSRIMDTIDYSSRDFDYALSKDFTNSNTKLSYFAKIIENKLDY